MQNTINNPKDIIFNNEVYDGRYWDINLDGELIDISDSDCPEDEKYYTKLFGEAVDGIRSTIWFSGNNGAVWKWIYRNGL